MQSVVAPLVQASQLVAQASVRRRSITSAVRAIDVGAVVGATRVSAVLWISHRRVNDLDPSRGAGAAVVGLASSAGPTERVALLADPPICVIVGCDVGAGVDAEASHSLLRVLPRGTGTALGVGGARAAVAAGVAGLAVVGAREVILGGAGETV